LGVLFVESHQPSELREIMIERANTVQQEKQKQGDANAANSCKFFSLFFFENYNYCSTTPAWPLF
jgi:hypothetical protein